MSRIDYLLSGQAQRNRARDTEAWADKERRLLASCHKHQRAFVKDTGRRICALVARGGGKTTGTEARLVRRMLRTPNARCVYIADTRDHARELLWDKLKETCDKLGIEARWNETRLSVRFVRNGATLRLYGADKVPDIAKLRGIPHHEVAIDEAQDIKPKTLEWLVERVIEPRLGDFDGALVMTGTPGHVLQGFWYDLTRPQSDVSRPYRDRRQAEYANWSKLGWSFHAWTMREALDVPAVAALWESALEKKRTARWSDDHPVWRREYKGEWAADDTENIYKYRPHITADMIVAWRELGIHATGAEGDQWNQWSPARDPRTGFAVLPAGHLWQYVYGMDLGHSDQFALEVFAYSWTDASKTLYHVYEYCDTGMYSRRIAELLLGPELDHENPTGVMGATGWPEGMVADMAALGGALLEELGAVYGVQVEAAEKKNKHDAIELWNGDLVDGRIKVLKGSALETQLSTLQWAEDSNLMLKEKRGDKNDAADAAIYARRKAMHLLAQAPEDPRPDPGTAEARDAAAAESVKSLTKRGTYDALLYDGSYELEDWL